jgi:hypothetical protein
LRGGGLRFRRTPPARGVGGGISRGARGVFMNRGVHFRRRFFGSRQGTLGRESLPPNPPGFVTSRIRGCVIKVCNSALEVRGCLKPLSVLKSFVFRGRKLRNDRRRLLRNSQRAHESAVQVHRTDAVCPGA